MCLTKLFRGGNNLSKKLSAMLLTIIMLLLTANTADAKVLSGNTDFSNSRLPNSSYSNSLSGNALIDSPRYSAANSLSKNNPVSAVKFKTDSAEILYMTEYFNTYLLDTSYYRYKQNLDDEQKSILESSLRKSYNIGKKMNLEDALETRPKRIQEYNKKAVKINVNTYHFKSTLSYGAASVGPWDLWFLTRASDMFWYHHWDEIYAYRSYFNAHEFAEMESKIKNIEAQGIARDPKYTEPSVDCDLQLSDDYIKLNINEVYYTNKFKKPLQNFFAAISFMICITVFLALVLKFILQSKVKKFPYAKQ